MYKIDHLMQQVNSGRFGIAGDVDVRRSDSYVTNATRNPISHGIPSSQAMIFGRFSESTEIIIEIRTNRNQIEC
jgi:hypothetical protein